MPPKKGKKGTKNKGRRKPGKTAGGGATGAAPAPVPVEGEVATMDATMEEADLMPGGEDDAALMAARRKEELLKKLHDKVGAKMMRTGRVRARAARPSSKVDTPDGEMDVDEVAASLGGGGGKQQALMMNMLESMKRFGTKSTLEQYGCNWESFKSMTGALKGNKGAKKKVKAMTGMDMEAVISEASARRDAKKEKKRRKRKKKREAEKAGKDGHAAMVAVEKDAKDATASALDYSPPTDDDDEVDFVEGVEPEVAPGTSLAVMDDDDLLLP